jgi:hypothetical protein
MQVGMKQVYRDGSLRIALTIEIVLEMLMVLKKSSGLHGPRIHSPELLSGVHKITDNYQ